MWRQCSTGCHWVVDCSLRDKAYCPNARKRMRSGPPRIGATSCPGETLKVHQRKLSRVFRGAMCFLEARASGLAGVQ